MSIGVFVFRSGFSFSEVWSGTADYDWETLILRVLRFFGGIIICNLDTGGALGLILKFVCQSGYL